MASLRSRGISALDHRIVVAGAAAAEVAEVVEAAEVAEADRRLLGDIAATRLVEVVVGSQVLLDSIRHFLGALRCYIAAAAAIGFAEGLAGNL